MNEKGQQTTRVMLVPGKQTAVFGEISELVLFEQCNVGVGEGGGAAQWEMLPTKDLSY